MVIVDNYEDIINLEHPEPKHHVRMSIYARSAQFAPFAALTGYEDQVYETGRLTNKKHELTEEEMLNINDCLVEISNSENVKVHVTYFLKDEKKSGGKYLTLEGIVKKIDKYKRQINIDGVRIAIDDIYRIEIVRDNYE
ncbi:MAG: hypothetical protein IJS56_03525 [Bacilli bacterium]|nr:hypothetical protein [Bacilli bacterium]